MPLFATLALAAGAALVALALWMRARSRECLARTGEMSVELLGDKVLVAGQAVMVLKGSLVAGGHNGN